MTGTDTMYPRFPVPIIIAIPTPCLRRSRAPLFPSLTGASIWQGGDSQPWE